MVERSDEWEAGYDVGYREGGSSRDADYFFALDDVLRPFPKELVDMSPRTLAAWIAAHINVSA